MAVVDEIDWEADTGEFLKSEDITTLINQLRGFDDIHRDSLETIKNEMHDGGGLSDSALNLDGEAPLNRIAIKVSKLIGDSCDAIRKLNSTIKSDGNTHRKGEAERYYEKVEKELEKQKANLESAVSAYNNQTYESTETVDENEIPVTKHYDPVIIEYDAGGSPYIVSIDNRNPESGNVKSAVETVRDRNARFIKAKQLLEETSGLETGTSGSAPASTTATTHTSTTNTGSNLGGLATAGAAAVVLGSYAHSLLGTHLASSASGLVAAAPQAVEAIVEPVAAAALPAAPAAIAALPAAPAAELATVAAPAASATGIGLLVGLGIYSVTHLDDFTVYDISDLTESGDWLTRVPVERPI